MAQSSNNMRGFCWLEEEIHWLKFMERSLCYCCPIVPEPWVCFGYCPCLSECRVGSEAFGNIGCVAGCANGQVTARPLWKT
eukprot:4136803-Amphidinium_carterae.1